LMFCSCWGDSGGGKHPCWLAAMTTLQPGSEFR
jgi:hypothetical protein